MARWSFAHGEWNTWPGPAREDDMATITAAQARDGDVVLAPDGSVYQLIGGGVWGNITPIGSYGPLWQPGGDLVLLARDGQPRTMADS